MPEKKLVTFERSADYTVARFVTSEISSLRDIDQPLQEFKDEIEAHKPQHLIIDFTGIEFVATTAINMLLVILKRTRTYGGDVYLCCLSDVVRSVFDLMQLNLLFDILPDCNAAVAHLAKNK